MQIGKSYQFTGIALALALTAACASEDVVAEKKIEQGSEQVSEFENSAVEEAMIAAKKACKSQNNCLDETLANTRKEKIVLAAYEAYNARDAKTLHMFMTDDVIWPDGTTDDTTKRLRGPDALMKYWEDQWEVSRTRDTPTEVTELPDGRVKVRLNQIVRSLDGEEISTGSFEYFFELRGDLISQLDITYL